MALCGKKLSDCPMLVFQSKSFVKAVSDNDGFVSFVKMKVNTYNKYGPHGYTSIVYNLRDIFYV